MRQTTGIGLVLCLGKLIKFKYLYIFFIILYRLVYVLQTSYLDDLYSKSPSFGIPNHPFVSSLTIVYYFGDKHLNVKPYAWRFFRH